MSGPLSGWYNAAKAARIIDGSRISAGPDGIMVKDGKKLSFEFLIQSGDTASRAGTNC